MLLWRILQNKNTNSLAIFSEVIDNIVNYANLLSSNSDVAELLLAPLLCYIVNTKDIVSSVTRDKQAL